MVIINGIAAKISKYFSGEVYIENTKIYESLGNTENIVSLSNESSFYTNPEEVLGMLFLTKKIRQMKPKAKLKLKISYIPYSREDKDTNNIELFSAFLELLSVDEVITTPDLHCRNELIEKHNIKIQGVPYWKTFKFNEDVVYVLPDKGSYNRYQNFLSDVNYITCTKKRVNGEVVGLEIDNMQALNENTKFVVIDDLCSGGATFKNVAELLPKNAFKTLIVAYMENSAYSSGFNKANLSVYDEVIFKELI